jgi:hypothetical protein
MFPSSKREDEVCRKDFGVVVDVFVSPEDNKLAMRSLSVPEEAVSIAVDDGAATAILYPRYLSALNRGLDTSRRAP